MQNVKKLGCEAKETNAKEGWMGGGAAPGAQRTAGQGLGLSIHTKCKLRDWGKTAQK